MKRANAFKLKQQFQSVIQVKLIDASSHKQKEALARHAWPALNHSDGHH